MHIPRVPEKVWFCRHWSSVERSWLRDWTALLGLFKLAVMSALQKSEIRKPKHGSSRFAPTRQTMYWYVVVCLQWPSCSKCLSNYRILQISHEDLGRLKDKFFNIDKMCFGSTTSKVRGRVADWQVNARIMLGSWLDRPRTVGEVSCVFCRNLNHTFRGTHSILWLPFLEQVPQWACIFLRCCEYVCAVSSVFSVFLLCLA